MTPAVLTITEAAYVLRCREASIVRLTREGRIPYRRIGRRLVFITAVPTDVGCLDKGLGLMSAAIAPVYVHDV
jgi:excisionase family DNA binding protein